MKIAFRAAIAVAMLGCVALQAQANPITLFNTGVTADGSLASGSSVDPHWTLAGGTAYVNSSIPGNWLTNGPDSKWIGPAPDPYADLDYNTVNSEYQTTFDLTGLVPGSASITGRFSVDNELTNILINGIGTGQYSSDPESYAGWHDFSIQSDFTSGINTLTFLTHNDGGPAGFRVEFLTATANPVPEPGTLGLFGLGLLGMLIAMRKRHLDAREPRSSQTTA